MTQKLSFKLLWLRSLSFGSFFVVLSAFNGKIQTFSRNNSWLTCLNSCTIESTTKEKHEELKIFLQKHLISSCFNQKLSFREREHRFIENFITKNLSRPIRWRMIEWSQCVHVMSDKWTRSHDTCPLRPWFLTSDFHRSVFE